MLAKTMTVHLVGLDAHLVHAEALVEAGPATLHVLGVSDAAVRETRVRLRAALQQVGVDLGSLAVTTSLSPVEPKRSGGSYDLALACAVLTAVGRIPATALDGVLLMGELGLTGALRPVRGVLPALRGAAARGVTRAIVSADNAREAAAVPGIKVVVAHHLAEVIEHFEGSKALPSAGEPSTSTGLPPGKFIDLSEVRGQSSGRRALEIAAAGGHDVLFMGPAGSGKTMLARRLPTLLPPMTEDEALEVTSVFSVGGLLGDGGSLLTDRPFRAPHYTVSAAGLVGGGEPVRPGEISLAHHGVLLLDELNQFGGGALDLLRQPLHDGFVTISRARQRVTFPARPIYVGAVTPCPCGYSGSRCACTPERVKSYRARLCGPIFDCFDLQVVLAPPDIHNLQSPRAGETSAVVRERVVEARKVQTTRARNLGCATTNANLTASDLERVAGLDEAGRKILGDAVERLDLPPRAFGAILRIARTIADLDQSEAVRAPHVAEAVHARGLDRMQRG